MTIVLILIILVVLGGAITLIIIGMRETQGDDPLQERLAEYAMRGQSATLEEIELSQPLTERVVFPLSAKIRAVCCQIHSPKCSAEYRPSPGTGWQSARR